MSHQPARIVADLANAHAAARCLHVIAELGVADALGDAPATDAELAARTHLNADALGRMLRLLAAHGIFAGDADGFSHTPASRLLRSDHPQSLRSFARMLGMPVMWRGFTDLAHAARTGQPAAGWASLLDYFAQHPDEAAVFNEAMTGKSARVIPAVVAAYDFTPFAVVADIGGGRGHLLQAILERAPAASGILFDLPHVIAEREAAVMATPRVRLVGGDFFADALPAADAYVLMDVLHDWTDADAARILAALRRSAPAGARVLIVEAVIGDDAGLQFGKTLDIIMLALTGGRERTRADYDRLLTATGFRLERVVATPAEYSIVEAVAG